MRIDVYKEEGNMLHNLSSSDDNYGAGGAFPCRDEKWAVETLLNDLALEAVPDAEDADEARRRFKAPAIVPLNAGQWPEVEAWKFSVSGMGTYLVQTTSR